MNPTQPGRPSQKSPPPSSPGRRRHLAALALALALGFALALPAGSRAASLVIDFATQPEGKPQAQFRPALTGGGPPPEWRILAVEAPSALPALPGQAPPTTRENVLAQLSQDRTDERFPLLVYEPETFADFTATLKFRTVSGRTEQMAGLAFRLVDDRNYYVVRVSSLGNNVRFYKFVDGVRSEPVGPAVKVPPGEWHTLKVICKGNAIRCLLDDREAIPTLSDQSFLRGKLAFWTKSDAVSHFARLEVEHDLVQSLPQKLVDAARGKFPRLLGVTVYGRDGTGNAVRALASSDPALVGTPGSDAETKAIGEGLIFGGTARDHASAVFPLRDRNGDPILAIKYRMSTFRGQTEANAVARGKALTDELEKIVQAAEAGELNGSAVTPARPTTPSGARKN